MADLEGDAQLGLIAVIVVAVGVLGYFAYEAFQSIGTNGGNSGGAGNTGGILGGGFSSDPDTGESNGVINNIDSAIFGSDNPGGGEIAGTSETYTGAFTEVLTSPIASFKSIFGIGSSN